MQLHPIALTMRSCGTELLECIMMTLFKKWEPFSFFFPPCKEEQDLTKQSGWLPAKESWKTVHYPEGPVCFSQALWNLFPWWISGPCFLGWLGSPFSEASPAHSYCTWVSSFLHISFQKGSLICLKLGLFRSTKLRYHLWIQMSATWTW